MEYNLFSVHATLILGWLKPDCTQLTCLLRSRCRFLQERLTFDKFNVTAVRTLTVYTLKEIASKKSNVGDGKSTDSNTDFVKGRYPIRHNHVIHPCQAG